MSIKDPTLFANQAASETESQLQAQIQTESAVEHVVKHWMPFSEAILNKALSLSNMHSAPTEELVAVIRQDVSLYFYCLRETAALLREEGVDIPVGLSPGDYLRWSGTRRLKQIPEESLETMPTQRIAAVSDPQKDRMLEALTSAAASEAMAERLGLDGDAAYSYALMRQMGYMLIAWNYRTTYSQALDSLAGKDAAELDSESLDWEIAKRLGFSPALLAAAVMERLDMPDCVQGAPSSGAGWGDKEEQLKQICSIGEALARASQPHNYPTAVADWLEAKLAVREMLGEQGLYDVIRHIASCTDAFVENAPEIFATKHREALHPRMTLGSLSAAERNEYFYHCAPGLQRELLSLYKKILGGDAKDKLLKALFKEAMPRSGFDGAAVYSFDPMLQALVPQAVFGSMGANLPVINCSLSRVSTNLPDSPQTMLKRAFLSRNSQVGDHRLIDEKAKGTAIAGVYGADAPRGVLYLCQTESMTGDQQAQVHFNALNLAMEDCLGLRNFESGLN